MRIAIACDHAAVDHKEAVKRHLQSHGHVVQDFGTNGPASVDYPDFAAPACRSVIEGTNQKAVLMCGSGIGISIAANKVSGIRCGLAHNVETARLAGEHNDAQALAIGARFTDIPTANEMVDAFLSARFEPRHQRRLDKIAALEKQVRPC